MYFIINGTIAEIGMKSKESSFVQIVQIRTLYDSNFVTKIEIHKRN